EQRCPNVPPVFPRIQPPQFPGTRQPSAAEPDAATGGFHQCDNAHGAGSAAPKRFAGRTAVAVFAASLGCRAATPAAATPGPAGGSRAPAAYGAPAAHFV